MGAFAEYLESVGIKPIDIIRKSEQLEALGIEDRDAYGERARARKASDWDAKKAATLYTEKSLTKPPTGRPISERLISAALNDTAISRKARQKIARAVNAINEKKGRDPVSPLVLFGEVKLRPGKPPKVVKKK